MRTPLRSLLAKIGTLPHYGDDMKKRIGLIILVLVCLGLGVVLIVIKKQAAQEQRAYEDEVNSLSNRLVVAKSKLDGEAQRSAALDKRRNSVLNFSLRWLWTKPIH